MGSIVVVWGMGVAGCVWERSEVDFKTGVDGDGGRVEESVVVGIVVRLFLRKGTPQKQKPKAEKHKNSLCCFIKPMHSLRVIRNRISQ